MAINLNYSQEPTRRLKNASKSFHRNIQCKANINLRICSGYLFVEVEYHVEADFLAGFQVKTCLFYFIVVRCEISILIEDPTIRGRISFKK